MLTSYFTTAAAPQRGDVFLMRGTEGETVANAKRAQQIEWFHHNERTTLVQKQAPTDEMPLLPVQSDATTTANWIKNALQDQQLVPASIAEQVKHCLLVSSKLQEQHLALRGMN